MSLSNHSLQFSKNHTEEEAERVQVLGGCGGHQENKAFNQNGKSSYELRETAALTEPAWDLYQFRCILWLSV